MNTQFAPGPWSVHPVDDTMVARQLPSGEWEEVAAIDGDYNQPDLWPTMEANARLIAAAPDLYEALKPFANMDFLIIGGGSEAVIAMCDRARAALDKVEGK